MVLDFKKNRIPIAKTLLDFLIETIPFIDIYERLIKKTSTEVRNYILSRNYCKGKSSLCGVFSKDNPFVTTKQERTGRKLVDMISKSITKEFGKVVITGRRLYYLRKKKIKTTESITNYICFCIETNKKEETTRRIFSKIMGSIPHHAIFLIDNERSGSDYEEDYFDKYGEGVGLGVFIPKKKLKSCRYIETIKVSNLEYRRCIVGNFQNCVKKGSRCLIKKMSLNLTTLEPFIKKRKNMAIVTNDLEKLNKIIIKALYHKSEFLD